MSISLINLSKNYSGLPTVTKVSLEVGDGELFVLLGGSGSGKSTILRLIAGLAMPDDGRVVLHGKDVTHLPPQARGTGFVFQNYSIFRHMTVRENIEFGLRVRGVSAPDRRRRSDELMELVDMAGLGERYADQLSGGQLQRVALARALAYEPAVLLLDEPFAALDVKIRTQLRRSFLHIQEHLKVTSILVTHDQEEGFEMADRMGILEKGQLLEVGTPQQLYHSPTSQSVATFVGGGNVLVGEVRNQRLALGSRSLAWPQDSNLPVHLDGARVRLLARPENLDVCGQDGVPEGQPLGQGRIVDCIYSGPRQRLRLELPELDGVRCVAPAPNYGQSHPELEAVVGTTAGAPKFVVGQRVAVGLKHYHLLERTGLRSLIVVDWDQDSTVASDFGMRVSRITGAPATLLSIAGPNDFEPDLLERLNGLLQSRSEKRSKLTTRVRRGPLSDEVIKEVRQGRHELVVIAEEPGRPRLGPWAQRLISRIDVPVVLLQQDHAHIQRVLICSGGGEPGKGDVWLGGRVAKRVNASATIVHAIPENADLATRRRAENHLSCAVASLQGMSVKANSMLLRLQSGASVAMALCAEMDRGQYDLIVTGAPTSSAVVARLIRSTSLPFLIVPLGGKGC